MKMLKDSGPKIKPCGETTAITFIHSLKQLFILQR